MLPGFGKTDIALGGLRRLLLSADEFIVTSQTNGCSYTQTTIFNWQDPEACAFAGRRNGVAHVQSPNDCRGSNGYQYIHYYYQFRN